jgi:hypothetical protein
LATTNDIENLRKAFDGPMSDAELELLRDFQGFIDSAIRNGLSFPLVLSILSHDINRIVHDGSSLEAARRNGFLPKATGWAKLSADDVGEPDESE